MNKNQIIILVVLVTKINTVKNNQIYFKPITNINQLQYHDASKNPGFLMLNHNSKMTQFGIVV